MIAVEVKIEIDRPCTEVFEFVANFENNPRWQSGMVAARFTEPGPLAVGTHYSQVARFLGREIRSIFEVVALDPGRMVKVTTVESTFPITITRMVEEGERGCTVRGVIEGNPQGLFRLAEPLLEIMVRRSVEVDYRRLKHLLERSEKPPGHHL